MSSLHRAGQLRDAVLAFDGLLILPLMILVAQETSVFGLAHLFRFAIVTALARLDARNQNIRRFLTRSRLAMA